MSTEVRVPTTGNAGEDAVVVEWNVTVGSQVSAGDVLVVLETAKSTIDIEAPVDGTLLKVLFESGDEAPEFAVLAHIGAPGERPESSHPLDDPTPQEEISPTDEGIETVAAAETGSEVKRDRVAASPRARLYAERNSIDLGLITGTGPSGRVLILDVTTAKNAGTVVSDEPAAPINPAEPVTANGHTVIPVRGARKVTAQRMTESLQTTAQVTLTRYAQADTLLSYVSRLRAVTEAQGLDRVGVNDVLLFATARAVAKHPAANSWFDWDGIRQFKNVNLGFAVDTGSALLVPVIDGADSLSLTQVGNEAQAAIAKARSGKLTADEMKTGTFTVSNLGSLGVHWFTPVLNTPQSCILGVGATHQLHPDGPSLLPLSLTFDHRALDGAAAASVLAEIAAAIETVDTLAAF